MNSKAKWNLMYIEAKKYYRTYDNLLVPYNYKTSYGINLGRWISEIRTLKKRGKLDKEKVSLLNEIGMIWDISLYKWDLMYEEAEEYYKKHKNLLVEESFVTENGLELGIWIVRQRQIYFDKVSGLLSKEQIKKLESIGMIWDNVSEVRWLKRYNIAKEFYLKNGYLPNTNKYKDIYPKIYSWLKTQKIFYRNNKLSKEKVKLLRNIGFILESKINENIVSYINSLFKDKGIYINIELNKDILKRISIEELKAKVEYLLANNISLVNNEGKLIDIFMMNSQDIKNDLRYGLTLEEIMIREYEHDIIRIRKNDKT